MSGIKLFLSDKIFNCISKYEKYPKVARCAGDCLGKIFRFTKDKEVLMSGINFISKYEKHPKIAGEIAIRLGSDADKSKKFLLE